ncbi:hypothetical protein BJX62DRAFT_117871 [Aspergillus germanicus]
MAITSFVRHRYEDEMRDRTCTTTGRLSVVIGWLGWSGVFEVSVSVLATPFIDPELHCAKRGFASRFGVYTLEPRKQNPLAVVYHSTCAMKLMATIIEEICTIFIGSIVEYIVLCTLLISYNICSLPSTYSVHNFNTLTTSRILQHYTGLSIRTKTSESRRYSA